MSFIDGILNKVAKLAPRLQKRTFDPHAMSIEDIDLPHSLMEIDINEVRIIIEKEVATFKSLDYINKTLEQIRVIEYHSYQIGLMLRFIKEDRFLKIANIQEIVPSFIMGATKKQLHIKVFDLVYRYDLAVNKTTNIEELEKEIKWTPQEAAYLLRYINMEDRKITAK